MVPTRVLSKGSKGPKRFVRVPRCEVSVANRVSEVYGTIPGSKSVIVSFCRTSQEFVEPCLHLQKFVENRGACRIPCKYRSFWIPHRFSPVMIAELLGFNVALFSDCLKIFISFGELVQGRLGRSYKKVQAGQAFHTGAE